MRENISQQTCCDRLSLLGPLGQNVHFNLQLYGYGQRNAYCREGQKTGLFLSDRRKSYKVSFSCFQRYCVV